jgi:hypothetical protein
MSYKFKSLSDTEIINEPAESAYVLLEDNGVIKRAPKTAIGGSNSGTGNNDYDLSFNHNNRDPILLSGNYDNILSIIESGKVPKVCASEISYEEDGDIIINFYSINRINYWKSDNTIMVIYKVSNREYYFYLHSDNSVSSGMAPT